MSDKRAPQTIAAASGIATDKAFGAVTAPLYLSSTFAFESLGHTKGYEYSRSANPSRDMLADTLAQLEGGAGAVVLSSGMAAIDLALSQLRPGDLVIAPHDCYAGTHRLLNGRQAKGHFEVCFVDQSDAAALAEGFKHKPSLVLIETPSNPLMRVVDIRQICRQAKEVGAKTVVDNTFLSPALQRPIALGADIVVHSTTKYLNGHSDVVGGALIAATAEDAMTFDEWANISGTAGAPFDSYMTLRGIRTLFPRIKAQQRSADRIARYLQAQESVRCVYYPGLESHPTHAIAKSQQAGFGAMLSFEIAGDISDVRRFVGALELFTLAESLGGVESLVAHPATMTHATMTVEARRRAGITDTLIRLSIGLEAEADLLWDLERAFSNLKTSFLPRAGQSAPQPSITK